MSRQTFATKGLFLFLFLILTVSCEEHGKAPKETQATLPEVRVKIVEITKQQVADPVEIMGTVQAQRKSIISSRISGHVTEVTVTPGSRVDKGDKLIHINAEEISAQLLQAKAQLDQANRNLTREKKLLAKKATTLESVKEYQDQKKIAEASYKEAVTMLSYTNIKAPFSGRITKKDIDIGDLAIPGKSLLHLETENQLQIQADVPESMALSLKLGMEMTISVPAANISTTGKVVEIAPAADSLSRTVPIKLDIKHSPSLNSGQFARVTLPGTTFETILIPSEALSTYGQLEKVFINVDGKARLRLVRSGKRYGDDIEILSGLNPKDLLILAGSQKIQDGQPVLFD